MKRLLVLVSGMAVLAISADGFAQTRTTTMPVSATVVPAVTVSASPLSFGNMLAGDGAGGMSTIAVNATNGLTYSIALDGGQNRLGTSGQRALRSAAGDFLPYTLSADPSATSTSIWGDGGLTTPSSASPVDGTGIGSNQIYNVYGRIPTSNVAQPPGLYTDTVTVGVHY